MDSRLATVVALASAQVLLYRIDSRQALKTVGFLWLLYLFLFLSAQGVRLFCTFFSLSFYEIPLLSLILFFAFGDGLKRFPRFRKAFLHVPNFYFLSSLWICLAWLGLFSAQDLWSGFSWSFFAALMLPTLTGIKEQLALLNPLRAFTGLPLFLMTVGFVFLGFLFFLKFSN